MSTFLVGRKNHTRSFLSSDRKNSWPHQLINIDKCQEKYQIPLFEYIGIYVDIQEQPNFLKINKNNNMELTLIRLAKHKKITIEYIHSVEILELSDNFLVSTALN